uniref:Uncharacterized protein n=1 Tax=Cyprinus carpio TaxID=7962 RepID=A0A8C2CF88_CYPCA
FSKNGKRGIPLSTISPKFLHANSTSHTWSFSAIAELINNAYDPDVHARQIWIDWTCIRGHPLKTAGKFHIPVGVYGNGFKSESMRLGEDAIVFMKTTDTMSVGLLLQA